MGYSGGSGLNGGVCPPQGSRVSSRDLERPRSEDQPQRKVEEQVRSVFEQQLSAQSTLMVYFVPPIHVPVSFTILISGFSVLAGSLKTTGKSKRGRSMYKNMFSDFAVSAYRS